MKDTGLLLTIAVGVLVGFVARAVLPGRQGQGLIVTTLLGIGGALLGAYGGQRFGLYQVGELFSFVGAVVGAFVLLFLWSKFANR